MDISMPGYIRAALHKFQHPKQAKPEYAPYKWNKPLCGKHPQLTDSIDTSPPLSKLEIKRIQDMVGTLLYYARAVDSTPLMSLNALASQQSTATEETAKVVVMILNYCATYPDVVLRYHKRDMILHVHCGAFYLREKESQSRARGHFFVSEKLQNYKDLPSTLTKNNRAVHIECTQIRTLMASAAEAEVGMLFINSKVALGLRVALEEMGHPQLPIPIMMDNSAACGIVKCSIKQCRSRAIDMEFY
eukprot:15367189-Ditylum_brightwellii.AAC.1